jgi:hypothetical protein
VEKSLRQSGLVSIADGLKDNIEKGIAWDDDHPQLHSILMQWSLWVQAVI